MTTHVNSKEKSHKLFELIDYYEVCNRAEGKSPKTISWYSANLKNFRNYLKNSHLPDLLEKIDTKLLRDRNTLFITGLIGLGLNRNR